MSSADLEVHEVAAQARRRQRTAWVLVLAVLAVLLGARALMGTTLGDVGDPRADGSPAATMRTHAFGLYYVKPDTHRMVEVKPATKDAPAKWEEVGKAGTPATGKNADAPVVEFTQWVESSATEWAAAQKPVTATPQSTANAQPLTPAQLAAGGPQISLPRTFGIWIAAFFTLAALSFLVGDNPAYKFTESVVVGVSAAYWMTSAFWETLVPKLFGALSPALVRAYVAPQFSINEAPGGFGWMSNMLGSAAQPADVAFWVAVIPAALSVLLLCRLNQKASWLGVFPIAFIVGLFAGLKFVQFVESDLLAQTATMFEPLWRTQEHVVNGVTETDWAATVGYCISTTLVLLGVLSVLVYFFFSLEHRGGIGKTARVGIWYLMITFGASFGFTVMGRIALLAARFEYLFDDWLWLIDPAKRH
ncbi:MAG: hypothetical protein U0636_10825 [Phycisphaerales bacterium]